MVLPNINVFSLAMGIMGIGFVIAFHEFGHFLFGKLFGVSIPSFSIGFGPRIFTKKIGSTEFSVSLIPIGGYVEAETGDYANPQPGTIAAIPYWQKMTIIAGGIFFNLIFAYCALVGLAATGLPANVLSGNTSPHTIKAVENESAAQKAGLHEGDKIIAFNETSVSNDLSALLTLLRQSPNTLVNLTIERAGQQEIIPTLLGERTVGDKKMGMLGTEFSFEPIPFSQALVQGFKITGDLIKNTFMSFGRMFSERSTEGLAGPVMMIAFSSEAAGKSLTSFFMLLALISISLAVINTFPLPILDGGQALTYTLEALLRRPLPEKTLEYIHYASWLLMIALFLLLTFKDLFSLFS